MLEQPQAQAQEQVQGPLLRRLRLGLEVYDTLNNVRCSHLLNFLTLEAIYRSNHLISDVLWYQVKLFLRQEVIRELELVLQRLDALVNNLVYQVGRRNDQLHFLELFVRLHVYQLSQ